MENVIIALVLTAIVGGIVWYLRKAKKRGIKCIGCPHANKCDTKCNCANSLIDKDLKREENNT